MVSWIRMFYFYNMFAATVDDSEIRRENYLGCKKPGK